MTRIRSDLPRRRQRADRLARHDGRRRHRHLERGLRQHDRHGAVVVRRPHGHARAVGRARHRPRVTRVGGVAREIRVDLDPDRMAALGATASDVSRQLRRIQAEYPGGEARLGGLEQTVRTTGIITSVYDLRALPISLARRPQRAARHDRGGTRPGRQSNARSRCSTASPSSASRSCAHGAPVRSTSPRTRARSSSDCSKSIRT